MAVATGVAQIATAGMYVLAARMVSPEQFGPTASAIALATAAVGFVDFGTNSLWVREVARGTVSRVLLGHKLYSKLGFVLLAAVLWCGGLLIVWPTSQYFVVAPIAVALLANQTAQVPLRGIGRADLAAVAVLCDRLSGAIVMVVLVLFRVDPPTALWVALVCGSLVAMFTAWRLAPPNARTSLMPFRWVNPWAGAGFYGVSNLATSAQSLDLTVMAAVGGPAVAGVYGAVNRWTQPLGLLVGAFSSASVPFVARAETWREAWNHIRSALWLPLMAVLSCIGVFFLSPFLVRVLIGTQYSDSVPVLQVLALATIPGIVNQPLAGFLQAMRYDRSVAGIMTVNVIVVLCLIALLTPRLGSFGSALSALLTQSAVAVALILVATVSRRRRLAEPSTKPRA